MIESVRTVGFGREASVALAEEVNAAKAGDQLAPVTVIVPSNLAGVSARRLLASGVLTGTQETDDAPRGIANVWFTTPYGLAARLAQVHLAEGGRRPLTNPVLGAAVRAELRATSGYFESVATHHATEAAVTRVFSELSRAHPETLDRIRAEGGTRAAAVVDLFERVRGRLRDFYDEDALARAAAAALTDGTTQSPGVVVWYLPRELSPALAEMLRSLAELSSMRVVVGVTHDRAVDSFGLRPCESVGVHVPAGTSVSPAASRIVSVSDADEEVRAAVGEIVRLAESGMSLDRMGVFYPLPEPYARLVPEHLAVAGVPHNGPGSQRVSELVAGRTLLSAIALCELDFERAAVISLLNSAPVRHAGGPVPSTRWDLISRRAGVVGGAADWETRLATYSHALEERLAEADESSPPGAVAALERELGEARALTDFVARLVELASPAGAVGSWKELSRWAGSLVSKLLRDDQMPSWPSMETDAAEAVERALARLALLDEIEPRPTLDAFVGGLAAELDTPAARTGRFGQGVVYGPLESAFGLDLDAVWILGLAEGTCPAPRREDSLLSDDARRLAVNGELALRRDRVHEEHGLVLAALGAGARERVMLYPRGDHRNGRARIPSRWMLRSASDIVGRRVFSSEFSNLEHPAIVTVRSYVESVAGSNVPAATRDVRVRELLAHVATGNDLADNHLAQGSDLGAGLALARARASSAFTRFDGNLAGSPTESLCTSVLSATRVEAWAECPFRFFLANVLGLGRVERPERLLEIDPRERGTLVHRILERFTREPIEHGDVPEPGEGWSADQGERLAEIAGLEFADAERRGVTGKRLLWELQKRQILAQLEWFLVADAGFRAEHRSRPERVEMAFGLDGAEPAVIALPDGTALRFRGRADRVDIDGDGSALVVDYKSGSGDYAPDLDADPVAGGTRLQLPIYALAACQQLDVERASAFYWYTGALGERPQLGYELTEERTARFLSVLSTIVQGIGSGTFPGAPGEYDWFRQTNANCWRCDFDELCPRDRFEHSEAKAESPELAEFIELAHGEPENEGR